MNRRKSVAGLLALLVVLSAICAWPTTRASAAPVTKAQISQAQTQAQALEQKVQNLNDQVEILVEKYDAANVKLASIEGQVVQARTKLREATAALSSAQSTLDNRVVNIYEQGQTSGLEALLGSSSISDLLGRVQMLKTISAEDASIVSQVVAYKSQVADQETALTSRLSEQRAQTAAISADKQAYERQYTYTQQALKGQEQQVAELDKTYQDQQAKLAAEARAAAAAEAAQAAAEARAAAAAEPTQAAAEARAAAAAEPTQAAPGYQHTGSNSSGSVSASGKAAEAVQIAMRYLGVPYVWGGSSPSGFDCSGLVMYVYAQLGVSLPHSAASQYGYGTHVSRSELEPGDLVFFGNPIHHVGIYVGNGDMINAPHTGADVRIQPLDSDYSGATRIF